VHRYSAALLVLLAVACGGGGSQGTSDHSSPSSSASEKSGTGSSGVSPSGSPSPAVVAGVSECRQAAKASETFFAFMIKGAENAASGGQPPDDSVFHAKLTTLRAARANCARFHGQALLACKAAVSFAEKAVTQVFNMADARRARNRPAFIRAGAAIRRVLVPYGSAFMDCTGRYPAPFPNP
jgi:hypothetical protein